MCVSRRNVGILDHLGQQNLNLNLGLTVDSYNHADSDWKYQELLDATNFEFFDSAGGVQSGELFLR